MKAKKGQEEASSTMGTFFSSIFSSDKTKNPERLMDDVIQIKILQPKLFMIDVRDKDGSIKPLVYEVNDSSIPIKIKAKIDYIKYPLTLTLFLTFTIVETYVKSQES